MNKIGFILLLILALLVSGTAEAKKKQYPNGDYYEGEWKKGQPHGIGKMVYANGNVYEGNWNFGQKENGKMIYTNGDIFEGKWDIGMPRNGKMVYANGNIYEGEYYAGTMKYGKMIYANGDIFIGWWSNGKHKNGSFTPKGEISYTGIWSNDTIKGSVQSGNLLIDYKGFFQKDNSLRATVEYKKTSSQTTIARYVGELKGMKRNGYGVLTIYENDIIVSGKWKNDEPESGRGSLTYNEIKAPLSIIQSNTNQYKITLDPPLELSLTLETDFSRIESVSSKFINNQIITIIDKIKIEKQKQKLLAEQKRLQEEQKKKEQAEKQRQALFTKKISSFQINSYTWSTSDINRLKQQNIAKFTQLFGGENILLYGTIVDFFTGEQDNTAASYWSNGLLPTTYTAYYIELQGGIIVRADSEEIAKLNKGETIFAIARLKKNDDYGYIFSTSVGFISPSIQEVRKYLLAYLGDTNNNIPTFRYEGLDLVRNIYR